MYWGGERDDLLPLFFDSSKAKEEIGTKSCINTASVINSAHPLMKDFFKVMMKRLEKNDGKKVNTFPAGAAESESKR